MKRPTLNLLFWAILFLAQGALVSGQEAPASGTHAFRGLVMGGAAGGAIGGFTFAYLNWGLCESECKHAFRDGFLWGTVGGGVAGGFAGLVLGSAFSRGPGPDAATPLGPWALRLAGGPRWGSSSEVVGLGFYLGFSALRPTTRRVSWGLETSYLGAGDEEMSFTRWDRNGGGLSVRSRWHRQLGSVGILASRTLGAVPSEGPYLLAGVGVYPLFESLRSVRYSATGVPAVPPVITEDSVETLPGMGIGAGGLWPFGDAAGLGAEGRFHFVFGAGDGLGLSLFSLGLTYLF